MSSPALKGAFTFYTMIVSFATLMILIFAGSSLINQGMQSLFLGEARLPYALFCDSNMETQEQCEARRILEKEAEAYRQNQNTARNASMVLVAAPLFLWHWKMFRGWGKKNEACCKDEGECCKGGMNECCGGGKSESCCS